MRLAHTIRKMDIGKGLVITKRGYITVEDFMGKIQSQDVGKRIYSNGQIYQVESNAQRDARLSKPN